MPVRARRHRNIVTEDLLYLLGRSGYDVGVDVAPPLGRRLAELLGHEVPGQLARAGRFPAAG